MRKGLLLFFTAFILMGCQNHTKQESADVLPIDQEVVDTVLRVELSLEHAKKIIELPLSCLEQEYPNKLGQVLGGDKDLRGPQSLRPIFYGCFDWHSSVHGFWSVIAILKKFPEVDSDSTIRRRLNMLITEENAAIEYSFFEDPNNRNFERTYGWAWFFQLHQELVMWDDPHAQRWAQILKPLANLFIERYQEYLPKLLYPIRTGTHDNTAFGLTLSLDYARTMGLKDFEVLLVKNAMRLYQKDTACSLLYEPSGHDFLSPCLEEARLMSKVLNKSAFDIWLQSFLPDLYTKNFVFEPVKVSDRTDGHLVHLDGLNFSRATCLTTLANRLPQMDYLKPLAVNHFNAAFANISDDDYMGSHWLGSFALYYLTQNAN